MTLNECSVRGYDVWVPAFTKDLLTLVWWHPAVTLNECSVRGYDGWVPAFTNECIKLQAGGHPAAASVKGWPELNRCFYTRH